MKTTPTYRTQIFTSFLDSFILLKTLIFIVLNLLDGLEGSLLLLSLSPVVSLLWSVGVAGGTPPGHDSFNDTIRLALSNVNTSEFFSKN